MRLPSRLSRYSGGSWNSTGSGPTGFPRAAKARNGIRSCRCWSRTRLIAPGSEWKLHRDWFGKSAMADLLEADFGLAEAHKLYACHDLLLRHKADLFSHLMARWRDLFGANFDVLLYDLTSTYFEINASGGGGRRQASRWLQPRQAAGLPAGGDRTGGHHGRSALGLRGAARQHGGLHDAADVPRQDRAAIRARSARLGDGSRHSDRSGAGGDARQRSAGAVSGGNAERASVAFGEATPDQALAEGQRGCPGQTTGRGRRTLCTQRASIAPARNARCAVAN